jgi:hypothetical protein
VSEDPELSPEAQEYLETIATPAAVQEYLETLASATEAAKRFVNEPREAAREYLQATAPNPNPSPWITTPADQPLRMSDGAAEYEYPVEDGAVSYPLSVLFDTVRAASARPPRKASQPSGQYLRTYDFPVDLGGEEAPGCKFILTVHLGVREEDREVICVGVDLRSFTVFQEPTGPVGLPLQHLTAARLRSLRLGEYVERAINACRALLREIADDPALQIDAADRPEMEQLIASSGKRRGRPPALTDAELVEFVVKPYLGGGRHKAERVRQSLHASGILAPLAKGGEVEIQQARKQIDRARAKGLLPRRGRKEQS